MNSHYIFRFLFRIVFAGIILVSFMVSCGHKSDPRLAEIDAKMEASPDSALMLIEAYQPDSDMSDYDRALYGLLLTHARYKNFIDETNDSLISASADYFIDHKENELAARSLFLKGFIELNDHRFGEASVSFLKGCDVAKECGSYMWEGQCARGLFSLYGNLNNGSQEIKYAKASYDAFSKGKNQDWKNYAMLNLLRAYHNHGEVSLALKESYNLVSLAEEAKDTMLLAETKAFIGACQYSLGDYRRCLNNFYSAYSLDSVAITNNQSYTIEVAASKVGRDSLSDEIKSSIDCLAGRKNRIPVYQEMANQGNFKEAYNGLMDYKNLQDSVLKVIMQNNVSESIDQYESYKKIIHNQKLKAERITWCALFVVLMILVILSVLFYKRRLYQRNLELEHLKVSLDMLRTDFDAQLKHINEISTDNKIMNEKNEIISFRLREMLYDKYHKTNELCDTYFQDKVVKSKRNKLEKEIESLLRDFSNQEFLDEISNHIDWCLDGIYSSFIGDFSNLSDDSKRLFMFLTLGLSPRTICVIFDIETSNFYNRKSRLKKIVSESKAQRKEEYLKNMA